MEKKTKRYYKENEIVWSIELKRDVEVKSIDTKELKMTTTYRENGEVKTYTGNMWDFDKLKYAKREEIFGEEDDTKDKLFFAKVSDKARIPLKAGKSEAGYDVWANLEPVIDGEGNELFELYLPKLTPTLIPTGIATSISEGFYLNFSNERGSTGKLGMLVLSGIIDSSYRGEVFVNITPLYKSVLITSTVDEVEERDTIILYPYSKAICQLIDYRIGESEPEEITYEELREIPSDRGMGALGSSGH